MSMSSAVAANQRMSSERAASIPRLCKPLLGDWTDVRERGPNSPIGFHVAIKAYGSGVYGAVHVRQSGKWLRMKVTPGWFCGRGAVYERTRHRLSHVATVRLCHQKKQKCILWQVVGADTSGSLPKEVLLWPHH
jgi:hypothetical protein